MREYLTVPVITVIVGSIEKYELNLFDDIFLQ